MTGALDQRRVRLLGGFELCVEGSMVRLSGPAARVVTLTALRGRLLRESIGATLWPDAGPDRAQAYLRSALWRLRSAAPGLLDAPTGGLLSLHPAVTTDAVALLGWALDLARDREATAPPPDPDALGRELLPGWDDPWLDDYREQLQVLVPQALEAAALARLRGGSVSEGMWYALRAHQLDPLRESAVRILLTIHVEQGNRRRALETYQRYRTRLVEELGIEPGPTLARVLWPEAGASLPSWPPTVRADIRDGTRAAYGQLSY